MADDEAPEHGSGSGHGLGRKLGPLPLGAWAVILGGGAGLVFFWRSRNSTADTTGTADASAAGGSGDAPTSLVPINEGLGESQYEALLSAIKGLQGGDGDDDDDDKPSTGNATPPPKPPVTPPPPKPKPTKTPPKPREVKVVKWTSHNTPWNSTLWGIAQHEHVKGGWQVLQKLNHISGDPKKALKPGQMIKLP